jgi:hypothetical protein
LLRNQRAQTLAIGAAVVALGGAALVDVFRDGSTAKEARDGRAPTAATTFPPVAASGRIALTDREGCELRVFDVRSGRAAKAPRVATSCELWAPRVGARVAYGVLGGEGGWPRFTVLDLEDPQASFGEYETDGRMTWGPDGSTVAWCAPYRMGGPGFELSLGQRRPKRLDYCPLAYDPDGVTATTNRRRQILMDGRPLLRARGFVNQLAWGLNGSLAVIVDGRRVDRYKGDRLVSATILPTSAGLRPIDLAPDNCAALSVDVDVVRLIDLGCFRGRRSLTFEGADAAWSPDGDWIVVAGPDAVVFHRVVGRYAAVRWNVAAAQLAWLSG